MTTRRFAASILLVLCVLAGVRANGQSTVTILEAATLWNRPTEQSTAVATLPVGTPIDIQATNAPDPEWYRVTVPGGAFPRVGYVRARFTNASDTPTQQATKSATSIVGSVSTPATGTPTPVPVASSRPESIVPAPTRTPVVPATRTGQPVAVTNADLVSMTTAGLSDDVIISAVQQAARADFNLSPEALIALKNGGVSDRVIQAVQARAQAGLPNGIQPNPTRGLEEAATDPPSSGPCGIFITEEDPPSRSYVVVRKEVQAGKKFYGSHDDTLMRKLAQQAANVGADAIITFHEWRAPSMASWAAAKAGGMAVKWTAEGKVAVSALKGQCWSPVEPARE